MIFKSISRYFRCCAILYQFISNIFITCHSKKLTQLTQTVSTTPRKDSHTVGFYFITSCLFRQISPTRMIPYIANTKKIIIFNLLQPYPYVFLFLQQNYQEEKKRANHVEEQQQLLCQGWHRVSCARLTLPSARISLSTINPFVAPALQ